MAGGSVTAAVLPLEEPDVDAGDGDAGEGEGLGDEEVEDPEEFADPEDVADPPARSIVVLGAGSRAGEAPIDEALEEEPPEEPPVEAVLDDGAGITRIDPPLAVS